jgi:prephenate dehydratase
MHTPDEAPVITSFIFTVRNVPAALYKAMGGFATNGVNMIKLESYVDGTFNVAQFYADIEGHPQDRPVRLALEELEFFTSSLRVLGVYKAAPIARSWRASARRWIRRPDPAGLSPSVDHLADQMVRNRDRRGYL